MEYRTLPRGGEEIGVLGLGLGGIQKSDDREIEAVIRKALRSGINYFDLCASAERVYAPFGRAIAGQRDRVYIQMHLGAVYNGEGDYAWSRDLPTIRRTIRWELEAMGTDYADMGFLHCVDEVEDFDALVSSGVVDYLKQLKAEGTVRHMGFSSHTPAAANRILDAGLADMMMFSINPAYDFERGDEYGVGRTGERFELFRRCAAEGVGISVMKPFCAGQLLDEKTSPFHAGLTREQCIQYALDRPGVLTVVPGVRGLSDLDELLHYLDATPEERDYSLLGGFAAQTDGSACVYCNHCQPCPAGIDIGLVNKYYDLALAGDALAAGHYDKLRIDAGACLHCGHCDRRCPFHVAQSDRMTEIQQYFAQK